MCKQEGYSPRGPGDSSVNREALTHFEVQNGVLNDSSDLIISKTFEDILDQENCTFTQFMDATEWKIYDIARSLKIFSAKKAANVIGHQLLSILNQNVNFADTQVIKIQLIDLFKKENTTQVKIDKEIFADFIKPGQKIPLDVCNAPEYRDLLTAFKNGTWLDGQEKTITLLNFVNSFIQSSGKSLQTDELDHLLKAIDLFFEDEQVQAAFQKFWIQPGKS